MVGSILSDRDGVLSPGENWVPLPGRQEGCLLTGKVEVGLSWAEQLGGRFQGLEGGRRFRVGSFSA